MKRTTSIILLITALVLFLTATHASADKRTRIGTISISYEGAVIGAERYEIVIRDDGNVRATGNISFTQEGSKTDLLTDLKLKGPDGTFDSYNVKADINKLPNTLSISYDGRKARVIVTSVSTRRDEEIDIHPDMLVVENMAFHLYQLVADRYDFKKGGRQELYAFLGTSLIEYKASLEFRGRMPITIADKTYYARRLFLNLENYGVHIWVDDNGELMKVESPIQGLTAVRTDYEGFEITDPATPKYQPSDKLVYNSVKFPAGDYELAGTLSFPLDTQGPKPCIVFINDTGPQDRHGFVPKIDLYIGTGELLDAISEAGFAVLRYDEPGIGESGGEYGLSMLSTTEADVNAALDYLSTRPDIDSGKLALIGHGEGAIVAMRIAAKRPEIRAIALLAPSAIPLDELAIWQTKRRLSMQGQPDDAWEKDPVVVVIEKARTTEDRWTLIGHKPVYLDIFREMIAADPQTDISKVKVPVYIAECGRDFQLPKGQGDLLSRAAESGGNESVHYRVFRNLDHFFRQGTGELSDYSDETKPIDEKFLGDLSTWLQEVLK